MLMDKADFHKLADLLTTNLTEVCGDIGRRAAEDMVARVLDLKDNDLRNRIRDLIREQVAKEVGKHLQVQVLWK